MNVSGGGPNECREEEELCADVPARRVGGGLEGRQAGAGEQVCGLRDGHEDRESDPDGSARESRLAWDKHGECGNRVACPPSEEHALRLYSVDSSSFDPRTRVHEREKPERENPSPAEALVENAPHHRVRKRFLREIPGARTFSLSLDEG